MLAQFVSEKMLFMHMLSLYTQQSTVNEAHRVCIPIYRCAHTYACTHICMYVCMHAHVHALCPVLANTHTYTHTRTKLGGGGRMSWATVTYMQLKPCYVTLQQAGPYTTPVWTHTHTHCPEQRHNILRADGLEGLNQDKGEEVSLMDK